MKKSELIFSALQVPVDFVMIVMAALTAYVIRDIPQIVALKPILYSFPLEAYIKAVFVVTPLFILIYALHGLYMNRSTRKFLKESMTVFTATSVGLLIIIVVIFLERDWFSSRFIILAGWGLAVAYVISARFLIQRLQKWLLVRRGIGVHRVLLIGSNGKMKNMEKAITKNPSLGYKVVARMDRPSIRKIKEIRGNKGIDEIIVCEPSITDSDQEKLVDFCAINNIVCEYLPTTLQTSRFKIRIFNGEPIISVHHTPLDGWGRIAKRSFDFLGSSALIAVFSPVMILTAVAVWLESGGPIIYRNERVGGDGRKFFAYKFRYMRKEFCTDPNTSEGRKAIKYEKKLIDEMSVRQGPLYKIKNDPRKTRVGNFIEKYSIDELPQFFNVLAGDMSLVGPRPHQEREVEKYQEYHRRLLTIKPGVTGMAQISGRSDLSFEDEYKLDVYYIENWSLWLDIVICLKTVGVVFKRRNN